ncbi:hypothetical protein IE53DRAFT_349289 [Violaceomyces palustris]|uniref:Uncharacterized protein n=1 Tax=Violaceomyces palustris TaxID=1673888 RepID=A0ACD0NNM6_9BASI|nr:hypothetical protein IE53DRAFT_349289 [Violaceomyces palustris]
MTTPSRLLWFLSLVGLALVGLARSECTWVDHQGPRPNSTWREYDTAKVGRASNKGWQFLPTTDVCQADLLRNFTVTSDGLTLPIYMTSDVDYSRVTRAVVVIAGKNRDTWSYFNLMRNARNLAAATFDSVSTETVAVLSPMFMTVADKEAGAPIASDLIWDGDNWSTGRFASLPENTTAESTASFDVLDVLLANIASKYPTIRQVVVAGHSMGAQMISRFSVLRNSGQAGESTTTSYFIANPGSWLWLEEGRPFPDPGCQGFDTYKYGLNESIPAYAKREFRSLGRNGTVTRAIGRRLNLLVGQNDNGRGDIRCQALTQGHTHKERGYMFKGSVTNITGSYPAAWTFDEVPGCTHNDKCMFQANISMQRLFIDENPPPPSPVKESSDPHPALFDLTDAPSSGEGEGGDDSGQSHDGPEVAEAEPYPSNQPQAPDSPKADLPQADGGVAALPSSQTPSTSAPSAGEPRRRLANQSGGGGPSILPWLF